MERWLLKPGSAFRQRKSTPRGSVSGRPRLPGRPYAPFHRSASFALVSWASSGQHLSKPPVFMVGQEGRLMVLRRAGLRCTATPQC